EMENCTFTGENGQLVVQGQGFKIRDSLFEDCKGISSSGLTLSSSISRTYFDMGGSGENAVAVRDNSTAGLTLEECTIIRANTGVMKEAGSLFLKCNDIRQSAWAGVIVGNGCRAYLDEPHESGHNVIVQNTNNILLDHAGGLEVYHGGNFIHTAEEWNISGSLSGTCNNCSDVLINGEHNHWSSSMYLPLDAIPGEPNAADFNITVVDPNCPVGSPPSGCEATIVDPDPVLQHSCSSSGSSGAKKSLTSSSQVEVWPNPASDLLHLNFGSHAGSGVWKLADSSGRTVISGVMPVHETTMEIDISRLATGYYFLALQWENEDYRIPVVVGK
ncbi:MAG: T9SS type A sorting domain-containing protein, partial [Flavobacteriales bacterium]|nr:T9SS type A sorting domain-containing protein [Flavobacteriales bacterium]